MKEKEETPKEKRERLIEEAESEIEKFLAINGGEFFSKLEVGRFMKAHKREPNYEAIAGALKNMHENGELGKIETIPFYATSEHLEDLEANKRAERVVRTVTTYKIKKEEKSEKEDRLVQTTLDMMVKAK